MIREEWIADIVDIVTAWPYKWLPEAARNYAEGLYDFFGAEIEPKEALAIDREAWTV